MSDGFKLPGSSYDEVVLGVKFEQAFILPNDSEIKTGNE